MNGIPVVISINLTLTILKLSAMSPQKHLTGLNLPQSVSPGSSIIRQERVDTDKGVGHSIN